MKNKTSVIVIGGVLVLSFAVMWVASGGGGGSATSEHRGSALGAVQNAEAAPDFTLPLLSGGEITLSDYRGEKPVILDFFATWCPNCRRDMPRLSQWYEKYKDAVEVIGVNLQERTSTVAHYIDTAGIAFPIALDAGGSVSSRYNVRYTNYHVLIDTKGDVVGIVPGDISERDILALIESGGG